MQFTFHNEKQTDRGTHYKPDAIQDLESHNVIIGWFSIFINNYIADKDK